MKTNQKCNDCRYRTYSGCDGSLSKKECEEKYYNEDSLESMKESPEVWGGGRKETYLSRRWHAEN